jgi:hypothetical protein
MTTTEQTVRGRGEGQLSREGFAGAVSAQRAAVLLCVTSWVFGDFERDAAAAILRGSCSSFS